MSERRAWTIEQDEALKHLREVIKVKKWSQISRRLQIDYQIIGRNGKQCRERYTNHLLSSINFTEFSFQEEELLFQLHDKIGNKWSQISKSFKGRTDNQIKNHFHSKLRKGIRKINKEIKLYFKKSIKPYKLSIVYKIVEASDFRFSSKLFLDQENLKFFNDLKNTLLQYAGGIIQQKSQISELNNRQQALLIISKLEAFENHMKLNKVAACKIKKNTIDFKVEVEKQVRENLSTQNSSGSSIIENQKIVQQSSELESLYQQSSIQFINQFNSPFSTAQQTQNTCLNSQLVEKKENKINLIQASEYLKGSFEERSKLQKTLGVLKQQIIENLIEEQQFPQTQVQRRMSIKSFQSLKEFEDNYLNDSQISLMLKRFDSNFNIEERLFE